MSKTKLSEIGEFGLIDLLTKDIIIKNKSTIYGVGDDAAIIENNKKLTLVTTDILTEGVHFDLIYTPLKHLGYKAVVVNLSDLYAMNATPRQITVSIAVSGKFTVEAIEELYQGIYLACENYGVDLIGGDTTSSFSGLIISVTAIGEAKKEDIVYRKGAKNTDLICVSGDLGSAYFGLQILEREKQVYETNPNNQPDLANYSYLIERQLKPEARKDILETLRINKIKPTSMIDISDGLSSELLHICKNSGVGCKIFEDKIPIDHSSAIASDELNISRITAALNGGEDYELLFTVPLLDFDKIKGLKDISIIGHITDESSGKNIVLRSDEILELKSQGWQGMAK